MKSIHKYFFLYAIFTIGFSFWAALFMGDQVLSAQENQDPEKTNQIALDDISDHLNTIDQQGLYELLKKLKRAKKEQIISPNPQELLNNPQSFRAKLCNFNIILHDQIKTITLTRQSKPKLHYITAKIILPAEKGISTAKSYATVVLLKQKPDHIPTRVIDFTGFFYMLLRSETMEPGPDYEKLDFIVLVADNLDESIEISQPTGTKSKWPVLLLGISVILWLILKKTVSRK
ncbi:MAG: hypothetical protein JEZ07_13125 [Phycisphaerae bacterium]|nr:hypothetical protein [Phycisphaerae bacterium]